MKISKLAAAALLPLAAVSAQAQTTVDVAKISCRQFIFDSVAPSKSIAVWLIGYYNGKQHNSVLDMGQVERNIDKVEDTCRLNLDMPVMDAAQKALGIGK